MSVPYIGEIRMFAGNFAPAGWQFCSGQLLPISEHDALFSLIGAIYGGDEQSTFQLPDLRGRIPIHQGSSFTIGETGGTETVTITAQQTPTHNHALLVDSNNGSKVNPQGNAVAGSSLNMFTTAATDTPMGNQMIGNTGGSAPHENMMPFQCISFIISLYGIYPSPT